MTIRLANYEDIPAMLVLGKEMHAEGYFSAYSFDDKKVCDLIWALITNDEGLALVAERDGVLVGGFLGIIHPFYFNHELQANDLAIFITKSERQGSLGIKLIKAYIDWAKSKNVSQIGVANSTGVERDRVLTLFERLNFQHVGYVMVQNNKEQTTCV